MTTIRKLRRRPIKVGDTLILYWKQRMQIEKKLVHKIGEVICTGAVTLPLIDFLFDKEVARKDGFDNIGDMQNWFISQTEDGLEQFQIIEWCANCLELDEHVFDRMTLAEYLTCWRCPTCKSGLVKFSKEHLKPVRAFEVRCFSCGTVHARSVPA